MISAVQTQPAFLAGKPINRSRRLGLSKTLPIYRSTVSPQSLAVSRAIKLFFQSTILAVVVVNLGRGDRFPLLVIVKVVD